MQIISNHGIVRIDTKQDLKAFNTQSLLTQAKNGEKIVSMMPAFKKTFDLMGDDIVEQSTEIESLENRKSSYDEKCLEESRAEMSKQINDEKEAILIMSRMQKQI